MDQTLQDGDSRQVSSLTAVYTSAETTAAHKHSCKHTHLCFEGVLTKPSCVSFMCEA